MKKSINKLGLKKITISNLDKITMSQMLGGILARRCEATLGSSDPYHSKSK